VLSDVYGHVGYAFGKRDLELLDLSDGKDDERVGVRFQAVFVPMNGAPTAQLHNAVFNYQATTEHPRNMLLLCTAQGTFAQMDAAGPVPQYLHVPSPARGGMPTQSCCMEVAPTSHGVTLQQRESENDAAAAVARGKAAPAVLGLQSMGAAFNRVMSVQVPLKQPDHMWDCSPVQPVTMDCRMSGSPEKATAARISYGTVVGTVDKVYIVPERDTGCCCTATIQYYFTVPSLQGVSDADVHAAIDLCEAGYAACAGHGRLMDPNAAWARDTNTHAPPTAGSPLGGNGAAS
jgi:hypothetical protein